MTFSESPTHPDAPRAGGETPPCETHAPRTYQSAWAWDDSVDSDSPPPMMRTAEEWLREEAYVQRQMADGDDETPEDDDLPDRAGIMEAIAKEIDTVRRERTQWAEAFTKLRAEHDALRASLLERHRDGERDYEAKFSELAALPENWDSYGGNRIWPEAIEAARRILSVLARPADVVPTTYGGIQLEWYRQGVAVEARITPEGSIEYADVELYTPPTTLPAASEPTEAAPPSPERASK